MERVTSTWKSELVPSATEYSYRYRDRGVVSPVVSPVANCRAVHPEVTGPSLRVERGPMSAADEVPLPMSLFATRTSISVSVPAAASNEMLTEIGRIAVADGTLIHASGRFAAVTRNVMGVVTVPM